MLDVLESGRSEVPLTVACLHDSTVVLTKTDNCNTLVSVKKQHYLHCIMLLTNLQQDQKVNLS